MIDDKEGQKIQWRQKGKESLESDSALLIGKEVWETKEAVSVKTAHSISRKK